jgi:cryptochrome
MIQLRDEGWIHHLARHSVACFLTRGDLYISWERGAEVFDDYLLDADWSLNVGNWLWLRCVMCDGTHSSASAFFHQYFRVYSPIAFGQKYDKSGDYIRRYIPALKDMPAQYIYTPWKAPLAVQKKAGCVVGKDYPMPIVDHDEARQRCMTGMRLAFEARRADTGAIDGDGTGEDLEEVPKAVKRKPAATAGGAKKKTTAVQEKSIRDIFKPLNKK